MLMGRVADPFLSGWAANAASPCRTNMYLKPMPLKFAIRCSGGLK
jgi:hypothetical protein